MKNIIPPLAGIYILLGVFNFLVISPALADQLTLPQVVTSFGADRGTMGIPLWKGYMDQSNPDHFWISFDNTSSGTNICYTTDAGNTWSSNIMQIDVNGYNDYHMSMYGRNGELFFTWPNRYGINFRKFNAPAHSNSDRGPIYAFPNSNPLYRSNIMVQDNGRIWVFSRYSRVTSENVRYHYSDDGGVNWTSGIAYAAGTGSIRTGAVPYINGNPALVVLYLNSQRGCEYYLWNGSSFERKSDASIYPHDIDNDRGFTVNVIAGQYMHLIIADGNDLYHCWKEYKNGTGNWNRAVIENSPYTTGIDWNPISCVRGDDLYVFYNRRLSSDSMSSMVYYRKWSQAAQTWSNPTLVSVNLNNQKNYRPNSCPQVPVSSNYVPVYWQSGAAGNLRIYFAKVVIDGTFTADFVGAPTSGYAPLTVNFTDQSTGSPTGWSWNFGDGGTATTRNPSHQYTTAGTYTVSLTATNAFGSDSETKAGYITVYPSSTWTTITSDNFETGWGSYTDGGADCDRYSGSLSHQGSYSIDIQDNSGTASSFYHTLGYNVTAYDTLEVDFWFRMTSMEYGENFWVQYYDGSTWQTVSNYTCGSTYVNDTFYHAVVPISRNVHTFPANAGIRFMCDASYDGDDVYIDDVIFRGRAGSSAAGKELVDETPQTQLPETFILHQNYPNPFNPSTNISFTLPAPAHVTVEIFNILGQMVRVLADETMAAGQSTVVWDGRDASGVTVGSGIYFYRVDASGFGVEIRKMLLLK